MAEGRRKSKRDIASKRIPWKEVAKTLRIDDSHYSTELPNGVYPIAFKDMPPLEPSNFNPENLCLIVRFTIVGQGGPVTATKADFGPGWESTLQNVGDPLGLWIELIKDDTSNYVIRRHGAFTKEIQACAGNSDAERVETWAKSIKWGLVHHPLRVSKIKKVFSGDSPPPEWFNSTM